MIHTDWPEVAFWLVVLAASVMFCGEPDMHDAIRSRVGGECIEVESP